LERPFAGCASLAMVQDERSVNPASPIAGCFLAILGGGKRIWRRCLERMSGAPWTSGQKLFRLAQLLQKLIQLHEMYARAALAGDHPTYREAFATLGTRERLKVMAKDRYPALVLSPELTIAAMLCPFAGLVAWVQEKVAAADFVLPPDPRR